MEALQDFLQGWENQIRLDHQRVPLFQPKIAKVLTLQQKQYFVKVFYHLRGHFHDFLWHLGNYAPDAQAKQVILDNIAEEFGGKRQSHEQLYEEFAMQFHVDILDEKVNHTTYVPFAREFNRGHLAWLRNAIWNEQIVAFAAYERLDNVDYPAVYNLAKAMGATNDALRFFEVHAKVQHYDRVRDQLGLEKLWDTNDITVRQGFNFIKGHQQVMWENLSSAVLSYRRK